MAETDKNRKGSDLLNQMGFGADTLHDNDDDDLELEAEFAALTGGDVAPKKPPSKKKEAVSLSQIEKMSAQALQDVDDTVSDSEDPELLSELAELTQSSQDEAKPPQGRLPPLESAPAQDGPNVERNKETQPADEHFELPAEPTEEESKKLFQAPEAPRTVEEALTQRLEKYRSTEQGARKAGDTGRARRMARIVQQYEAALKSHRAGKHVRFEDLPTPPGYGPIPIESGSPRRTPPQPPSQNKAIPPPPPTQSQPAPQRAAVTTTTMTITAGGGGGKASSPTPKRLTQSVYQSPDRGEGCGGDAVPEGGAGKSEQQQRFLQDRVEEFRKAALSAKRRGDLETAKNHMRSLKGLEAMLTASAAGTPVDLSQVPPSPAASKEEDRHTVVAADEVTSPGNRDDLFGQLEHDLLSQMRMCATNSQHFTKVGDASTAAKFQKLEQTCRKDLESLKSARNRGDPVPKFHYEARNFTVIQSNTDLGDGEMELTVVRGISLSLPTGFSEKDMDTVVKYELAYPSESPQTGQTSPVKSTVNPEYHESFKLQVDRKARSFARFVERKGIKLDIYIKRGLFKGEKLLGSATVKLSPLDTKCTLHDSFDLTEGRKSVGGKLEVKVRVREPFKGRQVNQSQEKWLVIDQFLHVLNSQVKTQKSKGSKSKVCTVS